MRWAIKTYSITAVRCAVGVTEGFEVKVGLHQGSGSSPCLFAMVMDTVAYPELVSRGVSKSRKFKWLVKVGACKDVNPLI